MNDRLTDRCRTECIPEELVEFLLQNQNRDGSWGYTPGKSAAIEATAYGLMALASKTVARAATEKALQFLLAHQSPRGGWPVNTTDSEEAAWVTALAGISLIACKAAPPARLAAARFLLSTFGKNPRPWILRVADWMRSWDADYVEENLGGWKWNPETANWVEPTAYALLFLKKLLRTQGAGEAKDIRESVSEREGQIQEIVREAECLLYLRMCKDGGWNYGNARVLGEELRPYPLTTAVTLLALQDQPSRAEYQKSLAYLRTIADREKSPLALSLAILCLSLHGVNTESLQQSLNTLYRETRFFRNVKTVAVGLLAFEVAKGGANAFEIGGKGDRL
jgi:hypothetical protein